MTPSEITHLATNLGITLSARPAGMLSASPASAITPELAAQLRRHKPAVWHALMEQQAWRRVTRPSGGTTWLRRRAEHLTADLDRTAPEPPADAVCRCGSAEYTDVVIHGGASTRRDCARCGRFIGFTRWHANVIHGSQTENLKPEAPG